MEQLFNIIKKLCSLPTVCGHEYMSNEKIRILCTEYANGFFDSCEITRSGSVVLWHKAKIASGTILLDAHMDQIGFCVSEILDDGFIRLENIGGIDKKILPACEIEIYGKETLRAFFSSVPPHLSSFVKDSDSQKVSDTFADTGLSREDCEKLIPIGTPCAFLPETSRLFGNMLSSVCLDNKICIAAILECAKRLLPHKDKINIDICVQLSSGEERGARGAKATPFITTPNECIVLDVNFAKERTSKPGCFLEMEKGAGLSLSSQTSRKLTDKIYSFATKQNIPCQHIVETTGTGTNADIIAGLGNGIECAVLSIPIKYMHSSVETASLKDVDLCATLLSEYILNAREGNLCIPVYNYKEELR